MSNIVESDVQKLLQEPYWSLEEIISVALFHKLSGQAQSDLGSEIDQFKADMTEDVINAIFDRTIAPVDLTKISRYSHFFEGTNPIFGFSLLCVIAIVLQKSFDTLPVMRRMLQPGHDARYFGQDTILSFTFSGIVAALMVCLLFYGYRTIKNLSCKTPQDKIDFLMADAKLRGLTEQYFISDNIIDFLNVKYRLNIPKDPFRVWKEPFLKRNGAIWIIGFMGKRLSIKHYVVLEKIAYLLGHPNKEIHSYEFIKPDPDNLGKNHKSKTVQDSDELDTDYIEFKREKGTYKNLTRKNAEELLAYDKENLLQAKECDQTEDILHYSSQIKMWEKYIEETYTRRGAERPPADSATKDADNLKREINRFITTVGKLHPAFAEHLKYIKKEPIFVYNPPDSITWDIRF